MSGVSGIKEQMEIIGADGAHICTVDKVEGNRIKLDKADRGKGGHRGPHQYYIESNLVRSRRTKGSSLSKR